MNKMGKKKIKFDNPIFVAPIVFFLPDLYQNWINFFSEMEETSRIMFH